MNGLAADDHRSVEVSKFVRATFGLKGTLRLHRLAFGFDLLRAPANVLLAPVFLLTRLIAFAAKVMRFKKTSAWLSQRKILLETSVSRQVAIEVSAFFDSLEPEGEHKFGSKTILEHEISEYTGVRSAVSEMTTTIVIILVGLGFFQVAELRAQSNAIADFPLGQTLGGVYYGVFSTDLPPWKLIATGAVLAMLASIVTTFAGVIADPIQVMTGTHRRRLLRLLTRLENASGHSSNIAREHITARLSDLTDIVLSLWRTLKG